MHTLNISSSLVHSTPFKLSKAHPTTTLPLPPHLNSPSLLHSHPTHPSLFTKATSTTTTVSSSFRSRPPSDITVAVFGPTGYIGQFVVRELLRRGFRVVSVARSRSGIRGRNGPDDALRLLSGSSVCFSDPTDPDALLRSLSPHAPIHAAVSCLASRSGSPSDSWLVDYSATLNALSASRSLGSSHFVLLSAICVQKPLLQFQLAKLRFESELAAQASSSSALTYSVVRPTAFFKSLAGQVDLVKSGKPYVVFGDGRLCSCKPISEYDLASFIADCVLDHDKINKILPIGGPGKALTPLEQGEMLFRLLGKEPKFLKVPIGIMDFAIGVLDLLKKVFPAMEDVAEFARIGRYYAAESMLVLDPETGKYSADKTPSYGSDTLEDFFKRVIEQGLEGQELGEQAFFT